MDKDWRRLLKKLDFAFQPMVNIHTGNVFGIEALLLEIEDTGFESRDDLFDSALEKGVLHGTDLYLRQIALDAFSRLREKAGIKLFYNPDSRITESPDYEPGRTEVMLRGLGLQKDDICFELPGRQRSGPDHGLSHILRAYRTQGYKISVDNYGIGYSGHSLLYFSEPDYIKIAPYFIRDIQSDPKKRLLVSTIVNFAHSTGCLVIAEGVVTREAFVQCREIGCDMVQGAFVQSPQTGIRLIKRRCEKIRKITERDKRESGFRDRTLVTGEITWVEPLSAQVKVVDVFDAFRRNTGARFFPVVNAHHHPVGVIRDSAFKDYIFSKFGRDILENPAFGKDISRFITKIPIADIHSTVEKLIETYTQYSNNEGLIMMKDNRYVGILSTNSLLKIINEKNLSLARNQNPLTKLPGNTMIHEYFSTSLADLASSYLLIYFDFDHFKPFNDTYGFRNGDRLILMFAEMLKASALFENRFAGHIGGDDFFLGVRNGDREPVVAEVAALAERFKTDAESFYDPETARQGYLKARDRDGSLGKIPLISVSAAILELPLNAPRDCSIGGAANMIAALKKQAKKSKEKIAVAAITEFQSG